MDKSKSSATFTKRQFLGAVAAASAVSVSPNLFAGNKHSHHHGMSTYSKELVKVAEECVSVGQACKAHIYSTLKKDNLSLAKCLILVRDTITTCETLVELETNGSMHAKAMAKVCIGVCKDCLTECEKHESKHRICKKMANSCKDTIKACEKYVA